MKKEIPISDLKGKIDFGIISIREDEFEAILKRFPVEAFSRGKQTYSISRLETSQGDEYQIAMVRCPEQGNAPGQTVTHHLIEDLDPQWILLVGIGGSIPSEEHTLGDVVLASRLHDFSISARMENEVEYESRGGAMHPVIQDLIAQLPALKMFLETWNTPEQISVERPKVSFDKNNFYGDDKWIKKIKEGLKVYFGKQPLRTDPNVVTGSVVSSDNLVKNTSIAQQWLATGRQMRAIEMELAGVYQAAWTVQKPVLAIRGISDIVGFKRSPLWTKYAANTAAAFTLALLKSRPVIPIISKHEESDSDSDLISEVKEKDIHKATKPIGVFTEIPPNPTPIIKTETLYSNLLEITHFPQKLYSVETTCKSIGEIWAIFKAESINPPSDWIFRGKTIYAFHNFTDPIWKKVCNTDSVEEHSTSYWSNSTEHDRVSEFIDLLGNCLKQLGSELGIRYIHKQKVRGQTRKFRHFYFAATSDLSERKIEAQSLKHMSTRTVFKAHFSKMTGKFLFYRHSAFRFEFSRYNKKWYLEISPHYHYTWNGYKVSNFYEDLIKGMKRLDQNEVVFRQVLFWSRVLQDSNISYPYLKFGELLQFPVQFGIYDNVWNAKDSANKKDKDSAQKTTKTVNKKGSDKPPRTKNSGKTKRRS